MLVSWDHDQARYNSGARPDLSIPVIFDAESKWKTLIPGPPGLDLDGAQIYSQREFIEIWRETDKSKDTKHNEDILQLYILSHCSSLALLW